MNSTELQQKYIQLKSSLEALKLDEARAETTLENLEKNKGEALAELRSLAQVETVEEAEKKLLELNKVVEALAKEAEEIINNV